MGMIQQRRKHWLSIKRRGKPEGRRLWVDENKRNPEHKGRNWPLTGGGIHPPF